MGTNYYLHEREDCSCCKRPFPARHIGKSSAGWAFSLHVDQADNVLSLDDWRAAWSQPGAFIRNEYGDPVSVEEMERIITERSLVAGLRRHEIDGRHCIGHGEGTWDYITGEFS